MEKYSFKRLGLDGFRFVLAGAGLTVFGYFLYLGILFLLPSRDLYLVAHFITYLLHFSLSYVVHSKLVFKAAIEFGSLVKYFVSSQLNLWSATALLVFLVEVLKVDPTVAPILNLVILAPLFFVLNRTIVFKSSSSPH